MRKFLSLLILFTIVVSCKNVSKKSGKIQQLPCDTMFYTLNRNKMTENIIDSILNKYNVTDCNFRFSSYFDTLYISFSVLNSPTGIDFNIPSNRFLLLKEKRIKVLSAEDFFLPLNKSKRDINKDPNHIDFALDIPKFNIIRQFKYPPERK